jgi:hypothetical protein
MSAIDTLRAARALGIELAVDGNDLLLEAAVEPSGVTIEALAKHKVEIIKLLRSSKDGWSADDWQLYFEERAAVAEFDGGLPRADAEAQAFECCIVEWLNRNPTPSAAGRCAWCGEAESRGAVVVPYGTEPGTHAWLHAECWPAWHERRRSRASEALAGMGISADTCNIRSSSSPSINDSPPRSEVQHV